jgi:hypothetical protein
MLSADPREQREREQQAPRPRARSVMLLVTLTNIKRNGADMVVHPNDG